MAEIEPRHILRRLLAAKDDRDLREEEIRREEEIALWRSEVYRQAVDVVNR